MDRAQKAAVVAELESVFETSGAVIVCHYAGLTVAQMSDLRLQMRQQGGAVRVAKNRLAKIALKGKVSEGMSVHLNGQTVLIYSEDPVAPAKVAEDYAKKNDKLVILGGAMGSEILDRKGVESLSKMPSREEMLGRIVSALMGPGAQLAGALKGPGGRVAGAIKSIAEKEDA